MENKRKLNYLFFNLLRFLIPYKFKCTLLMGLILFTLATLAIQPIIWSQLLSTLYGKEFSQFKKILIVTVIFYLIKLLINYLQSKVTVNLKTSLTKDIQNDLFCKLLNKQMLYFDCTSTGKILQIISDDVEQVVEILLGKLMPAVISALQVILFLVLMLKLNIFLTLISLLFLPILMFYYYNRMQQVREGQVNVREAKDAIVSFLQQAILGIKVIKTLGVKQNQSTLFYKNLESKRNKNYQLEMFILRFQTVISVLGVFSEILTYLIGGILVFNSNLSIEGFIQFSSYSQQFNSSSLSVTNIAGSYQQLLVSLQRISTIGDESFQREVFGKNSIIQTKSPSIKLENVNCQLMNQIILSDVNIYIKGVGIHAIVGDSGSGKTTLVNHLLKLYSVESGMITISNENINEITEQSLRNHIALVSQRMFTFHESVFENFRHINPFISIKEVRFYCADCGLDEDIMQLPNQYETIIEENGNNFSLGQIQRLSIAMALAKNTPILVLDEPTSALDNKNTMKIRSILENYSLSKLIILITHDLKMIENVSSTFVISDKHIYRQS